MVQLSTPGVTPNRGMGPPVRRFLSNYFDLLLALPSDNIAEKNHGLRLRET